MVHPICYAFCPFLAYCSLNQVLPPKFFVAPNIDVDYDMLYVAHAAFSLQVQNKEYTTMVRSSVFAPSASVLHSICPPPSTLQIQRVVTNATFPKRKINIQTDTCRADTSVYENLKLGQNYQKAIKTVSQSQRHHSPAPWDPLIVWAK